jgi:hypothetical protein
MPDNSQKVENKMALCHFGGSDSRWKIRRLTRSTLEARVLICHRADQDAIDCSAARLSHLFRLSRRGQSLVLDEAQHADLPIITLTNISR